MAKCWRAVAKYCQKDNNFISNIDIDSATLRQGKHVNRNKELLSKTITELVNDGNISLSQVFSIKKAKEILQQEIPPLETDDVRGLWYVGPPGTGKSTFARTEWGSVYIKA